MLCVLCLIVLWGLSLVTSYSGVKYYSAGIYTDIVCYRYSKDIGGKDIV